jgi:hypothetical protein
MSTALDHIRPACPGPILAEAATPTTALAGPRRHGGGLVLLGAAVAVARLAGAVLLVLGAAVAGTVRMTAKLLVVVLRIAVLTWAIGRPGRGVDELWP